MTHLLLEYGLQAWYTLAGAALVFCGVAWWLEARRARRHGEQGPWL